MRVSCIKGDSGYRAYTRDIKIFVDGLEVHDCYTADEELGIAYCYQTDDNGQTILDGDKFLTIEVKGKIEIKFN